MGSPLLHLVLNFGKLIGLVPIYDRIFFGKLYAANLTILLLLGSAVSIANRASDYREMRHFKLIYNVSIDVVTCSFSVVTIVGANFCHRKKWLLLIEKLQSDNHHHREKIPHRLEFFLVQLVIVSVTIYEFYAWTEALGDENYKQYTVYYVQLYFQYYHTFLMSVIIRLVVTKYQFLNRLLRQQLKFAIQGRTTTTTANFVVFARRAENQLFLLKEIVEGFNEIFGYPILLLVFYFGLMLQDCLNEMSRNNFGYAINDVFDIIISNISVLVIFAICTVVLTELCYKVVEEAKKTWRLCVKLQRVFDSRDRQEWMEMDNLIDFLSVHPPKFTAARVFEMTRRTILSIISVTLGYLIVIMQFKNDKIWQ